MRMDDKQIVGENIKALRLKHKVKRAWVAEMIGVDDKAVENWENGVNLPLLKNIKALAKLFVVREDEIYPGLRCSGRK